MSKTFFDVLGVPRAFHLDASALEAQLRALSKQFHPDRFAKAAPHERMVALQRTTELNDAYRVLKDPVRRAEYLLKLEGIDVADERSAQVKAPPALLAEVLELNESLADARLAHDRDQVEALAAEVRARRERAMRAVDEGFGAFEKGDRSMLRQVAEALVAMRYHARFLEQVEAFEELEESQPSPSGDR